MTTIEDIWESYERLYNWLGFFLDVEADEVEPPNSNDLKSANEAFSKALWIAHFNEVRAYILRLEDELKKREPKTVFDVYSDIRRDAAQVCLDVFHDFTEEEVKSKTASIRKAWNVGKTLEEYLCQPQAQEKEHE